MNEPMTDSTDTFARDVAALLRDLAIVRKAQSGLKKEIDLVNGEEKALKEELLGLMQAQSMTGCNRTSSLLETLHRQDSTMEHNTYIPLANNRSGHLYASGEEAMRFDLIRHRKTGREGIVFGVQTGGRLRVGWIHRNGIGKRVSYVMAPNVDFIRREARMPEVA